MMTETTSPAPAANKVPGFGHKLGHLAETVFSLYGLFGILFLVAADVSLHALWPQFFRTALEEPVIQITGGVLNAGLAVTLLAIRSSRPYVVFIAEVITLIAVARIVPAGFSLAFGGMQGIDLALFPGAIIGGVLLALSMVALYSHVQSRKAEQTEEGHARKDSDNV